MAAALTLNELPEHILLRSVSWSYYERTLAELENQNIRLAYLDGMLELMSPLPKHEGIKSAIGTLITFLAFERGIGLKSFGSTTFRDKEKSAGAEPDESFYFGEVDSVRSMEQFDPAIHRPPDLWIEVDILNPSIAREPIYARLGVPEVWRYGRQGMVVRVLTDRTVYFNSSASLAFPFLPMKEFGQFVTRLREEEETAVLREFAGWVRSLP